MSPDDTPTTEPVRKWIEERRLYGDNDGCAWCGDVADLCGKCRCCANDCFCGYGDPMENTGPGCTP